MGAMPPFSGDESQCCKCMWTEAAVEWVGYRQGGSERGSVKDAPPLGEFLLRSCKQCGFRWAEATMDSVIEGERITVDQLTCKKCNGSGFGAEPKQTQWTNGIVVHEPVPCSACQPQD